MRRAAPRSTAHTCARVCASVSLRARVRLHVGGVGGCVCGCLRMCRLGASWAKHCDIMGACCTQLAVQVSHPSCKGGCVHGTAKCCTLSAQTENLSAHFAVNSTVTINSKSATLGPSAGSSRAMGARKHDNTARHSVTASTADYSRCCRAPSAGRAEPNASDEPTTALEGGAQRARVLPVALTPSRPHPRPPAGGQGSLRPQRGVCKPQIPTMLGTIPTMLRVVTCSDVIHPTVL